MRTYKIHFIRHGQTQANLDGLVIGSTDVPLNEGGKEMLIRLRDHYSLYPMVERVYSSPLIRCTETAEIIYPREKIYTVPNLREINFGVFEKTPLVELQENQDFMKSFAGTATQEVTDRFPQGESGVEFIERLDDGLREIVFDMSENDLFEVAVVAHGGVISSLLAKHGFPEKTPAEWYLNNGEGFTISVQPILWNSDEKFEVYEHLSPNAKRIEEEFDEEAYLDYAETLVSEEDLKEH